MKRICLFILAVFLYSQGNAQMEVLDANTPPLDPQNLINNIFLGEGVDVLNITFEGDNAAVGFFKNAQSDIGIDRGIVMTSGRAASNAAAGVVGADGTGGQFAGNDSNSGASDPDATAVASSGTDDMAIFTITFIPISDTLRFRYVWGSEEYPTFACSEFNDIFGFFISGPGITGPFENMGENIALIPGTNLPVTINNLNSGVVGASGTLANCTPPNGSLAYSNFYVDNTTPGTNQPVYDGYTTVLTAEAVVIPCETYTIKLIIADVGDNALDSGVFLEAKSFGTGTLQVEASTLSLDGAIAEGCEPGALVFEVPIAPEVDLPLDYEILGTATNGVDYELVADDIFIPAGDTMVTIPIIAIPDGIVEGEETIWIDIALNVCTRDTIQIKIADNPLLAATIIEDTTICAGEDVMLDGTLPVFIPPPKTFTNDTNVPIEPELTGVSSSINVTGVFPEILGPAVVESVCLNLEHRWVDDLDIFLITPSGQFLELSTHNGANGDDYTNTCFTPSATTIISFPGPWAPASAAPFTGDWQPEGPWSDLYGSPTNGTWELLITDQAMGFTGEILDWTITFAQIYDIFYEWTPNQTITCTDCPMVQVNPQDSTRYTVIATDTYGCRLLDSVDVNVLDTLPPPEIDCQVTNSSINFSWLDLPGSTGYEVNIDGGGWMPANNGTLAHLITGLSLDDSIQIEVRGISACGVEIDTLKCATPICAVPDLVVDDLQNVSCFGAGDGSITVSASGGVGGFMYSLDLISNGTGQFTGLIPGTYEIIVTDAISCSRMIEVEITEPAVLDITASVIVDSIDCFGETDGIATIMVEGGTYPYMFSWDGGAQLDSIAVGLGAGLHNVTVTDFNGCTQNFVALLQEPDVLTTTSDSTIVGCQGDSDGTATVAPAGGTQPYSYLWDAAASSQTDATAIGLAVGTYQVTITDAEGCSLLTSVSITEPPLLEVDITFTNPNCPASEDGTATVSPSGGTPGYTYIWDDPAGSTTETASGLDGLLYSVTITDASGCTFDTSAMLVAPDSFELMLSSTPIQCFDGADGTAMVVVNNIDGPETYEWSNGVMTAAVTGLRAEEYCVTVTDVRGCTQSACITPTQPEDLLVSSVETSAGCTGQSNGTIDLTVMGGTQPYRYQWSNTSSTEDLANLPKGSYTVTVTDDHNCSAILSVDIDEGAPFTVAFNTTDITCFEENDGIIDLDVIGGLNINYNWSGPQGFTATSEDLDSLADGQYIIIAVDPQGCTVSDSVMIFRPDSIEVNYAVEEITCFGSANGRVTFEVTGGTGPYLYTFGTDSIFQSQAIFGSLSGATYTYVIQDAAGCMVVDSLTIIEPAELVIDVADVIEIKLGESHTYDVTVNTPLSQIDSIRWFPTDSLSCINCLDPTTDAEYTTEYWVEVFTQDGCYAKGFTLLVVDRQVSVYVPTGFSPNEDGANDVLMVYGKEGSIKEIVSFQVFNRWGGHVHGAKNFQPNDPAAGWDGKLNGEILNDAVFTWYVEVELLDGKIEIITGDVMILK